MATAPETLSFEAALARLEIGHGEAIYFWGCVAHAAYTPMVRRLNLSLDG